MSVNGTQVLESNMCDLRSMWEETSTMLERRQASVDCVQEEFETLRHRTIPRYNANFDLGCSPLVDLPLEGAPRVAILREEGSNGDREMAAAFTLAGFECWDVNMQVPTSILFWDLCYYYVFRYFWADP